MTPSADAPHARATKEPDLDRVLAADLRELVADLGTDDHTWTSLAMLERHLHHTVPSALGLTFVLPRSAAGPGVRVNLLRRRVEPIEVAVTLEIALAALALGTEGAVVLYASHRRAFAHLGSVLGLRPDDLVEQAPPASTIEPGIEGLHDRTTVNRGLGVLLNRGHDLVGARDELQYRAAENGTDLAGAARALLQDHHGGR